MIKKSSRLSGILLLIFSLFVIGVSAYVYEQATMSVSQTIIEIASITVTNSDLGSINEGETKTLTKTEVANLGDAISMTTTTANVYLHLDSDIDSQSGSYTTYNIVVKYATVPGGSSASSGSTACTLSIASPDYSSITLDVAGDWTFDLEVTNTADSVSTDTPTSVSIIVSAESTS